MSVSTRNCSIFYVHGKRAAPTPLPRACICFNPNMSTPVQIDRKEIELLAYYVWEYRGRPMGSPDRDWYAAEQILAYRTLYPLPSAFTCGIDDVATGGGATSGSTFFVLPVAAANDFSLRAASLVPAGRNEFHAAEMRKGEENAYEAFLALVAEFIEANPYSLVCTLGADLSWRTEFSDSAERICEDVLKSFGVADRGIAKRLTKLSPPLWNLARLLRFVGNTAMLILEIDTDSMIGGLAADNIPTGATSISGTEFLARLANAYSTKYFVGAPRLGVSSSSVQIVPSQNSFMVQAADVVGNFALANASYQLGLTTTGRKAKSEIFQRVFGPQPAIAIQALAQLTGDEIEPAAAGNLKFLASDHFYDV
jgi:hypothetical protein